MLLFNIVLVLVRVIRQEKEKGRNEAIFICKQHGYLCRKAYRVYKKAIRNNELLSFTATWMDTENTIPSVVRQRKTNITEYHLYMKSKKQYKWIYRQNRDSQR